MVGVGVGELDRVGWNDRGRGFGGSEPTIEGIVK